MPIKIGRQAIDQALEGVTERLHLVFFGGEPLLEWSKMVRLTEDCLNVAASQGVAVRLAVTTNGTLMTDDRAEWLARNEFVVAISCDGTRGAHDAHRVFPDGRGSHAAVVDCIERTLTAGLAVRVVLVLRAATVHLLPTSIDYLRGLGVAHFVVNVDWSDDWSDVTVRDRWRESYESVAALYGEAYRNSEPFWISMIDDKISAHIKSGFLPSERCNFGRTNLVVAPSGNLYPCDRLIGEDKTSTLVIGTVDAGVDRERFCELLKGCQVPTECRTCAIAKRCRHTCACANLAMGGTLSRPKDVLCFHEELSIRVADRVAESLYKDKNPLFIRHYFNFSNTTRF